MDFSAIDADTLVQPERDCPFCRKAVISTKPKDDLSMWDVDCPRCGHYRISETEWTKRLNLTHRDAEQVRKRIVAANANGDRWVVPNGPGIRMAP